MFARCPSATRSAFADEERLANGQGHLLLQALAHLGV